MRFGFRCPLDHEVIDEFTIGQAPPTVLCVEHGVQATRVFDVPQFTEDRRRMRQPTPHAPRPDWSWSLGAPAPQSRAEMRAIEKAQGIEFVTRDEARRDVEKLRAGKNLDEPKKLEKGWLAKEVAKRGIRFDRSLEPPRPLTREESERKLAAERDWTPSGGSVVAPATVSEAVDVGAKKVAG